MKTATNTNHTYETQKDHAEAILNLRYYARELESDNREQRELLKDAKLNFARIAGVAENSQSAQLARLLKIKTLAEEAIAEFGSDGPDHNQANEILGKPHYSP